MQVLELVKFRERMSCDRKHASAAFIVANGRSEHHFLQMGDVLDNYGGQLKCFRCKDVCQVGGEEGGCDIFVCGPPCSPYSLQRRDRWTRGCLCVCERVWLNPLKASVVLGWARSQNRTPRELPAAVCLPNLACYCSKLHCQCLCVPRWSSHPDAKGLLLTISLLKQMRPRACVIENVMGMEGITGETSISPLQYLIDECTAAGYICRTLYCDLNLFHCATRRRQVGDQTRARQCANIIIVRLV